MKIANELTWIAALVLGLAFAELNAAEADLTNPAQDATTIPEAAKPSVDKPVAVKSKAEKPTADQSASDATGKPLGGKQHMTAADSAKLERIAAHMAAWQEKRRKSEDMRTDAREKEMREAVEKDAKTMETSKGHSAGKGAAKEKPDPAKKGAAAPKEK